MTMPRFSEPTLRQCKDGLQSTLQELFNSRNDLHSDVLASRSQALSANSDCPFIPDLLFALLMSVYQTPTEPTRVLQQDWVKDWDGWEEARRLLDTKDDDAKHKIAEEFIM